MAVVVGHLWSSDEAGDNVESRAVIEMMSANPRIAHCLLDNTIAPIIEIRCDSFHRITVLRDALYYESERVCREEGSKIKK